MKKILIVTNLFPTKLNPDHGVFVKNIKGGLEANGNLVDVAKCGESNKKIINYAVLFFSTLFLMLTRNYDLIYCHFSSHTFFVHILKKILFLRIKVITHLHGSDGVATSGTIKYKVNLYSLRRSDLIICPSEAYMEYIKSIYSLDERKKFYVFPSGGVKDDFYQHGTISERVRVFGYIGRLVKEKGIYTLLNAFNNYKREDEFAKLVICGYGSEREKLLKYIVDNKILDVEVISQVNYDNLPAFFNSIDCLVFPTEYKYESLGLVGLEAFSLKTFLISSNALGPSSYGSADYSLFFNVGDEYDLLDKMKTVSGYSFEERKRRIERAFFYSLKYKSSNVAEELNIKVIELCL